MNGSIRTSARRAPLLAALLGVALGAAGARVVSAVHGPQGALAAEAQCNPLVEAAVCAPRSSESFAPAATPVAAPAALDDGASRRALNVDDSLGGAIALWRSEGWIDDASLARAAFADLLAKRRPAEAAECGMRFLADFTSDRARCEALATAFAERGEFSDARVWLARALGGPADAALLERYAAWDAIGALEQARALLATVDPLDTDRHAAFARLLTACGKPLEGRELLQRRLAARPDDTQALAQLWSTDADAAEQHLRGLGLTPATDREFRQRLFEVRLERGDFAGAEALLDQSRTRAASDAAAFAALAAHRMEAGAQDEASRLWARAIDCEPEAPAAWIARLEQIDADGLRKCLEARVARDGVVSGSDEIWGALGDARWRAGEGGAARTAWSTAAALDPDDREWSSKLDAARDGLDPLTIRPRD